MDEQALMAQRDEEKRKLAAAIDAFGVDMQAALAEYIFDMKTRAFQKVDEGYVGWDDPQGWSKTPPSTRLFNEAVELRGVMHPARYDRNCVDAGLFSMFCRVFRRKQQEA